MGRRRPARGPRTCCSRSTPAGSLAAPPASSRRQSSKRPASASIIHPQEEAPMPLGRRAFLATIGASLAAPRILRARARNKRYPIAFSTLGCPAWSFRTILDQADRLGYSAIELRGIAGEMDLPKVPELAGSRLAETRKDLAALGLVVSDLGASARMHEKDAATREKQLDEGRRFIDLAHALGVKYVRMFGDKMPEGEARDEVLKRVVDGFQKMAAHAKAAGVVVLIESHGDFTHSRDLEEILKGVGSDAFALLWDAHHTFVAGGEQPAETDARLRPGGRPTPPQDPKPQGSDPPYVVKGGGEGPGRRP